MKENSFEMFCHYPAKSLAELKKYNFKPQKIIYTSFTSFICPLLADGLCTRLSYRPPCPVLATRDSGFLTSEDTDPKPPRNGMGNWINLKGKNF